MEGPSKDEFNAFKTKFFNKHSITMDIEKHRQFVIESASIANMDDPILGGILGIGSEAGELLEHIKKVMFQGHKLDESYIIKELGDALWYIQLVSHGIGVTLDQIMQVNVDKLKARYPEGYFSTERSLNRTEDVPSKQETNPRTASEK